MYISLYNIFVFNRYMAFRPFHFILRSVLHRIFGAFDGLKCIHVALDVFSGTNRFKINASLNSSNDAHFGLVYMLASLYSRTTSVFALFVLRLEIESILPVSIPGINTYTHVTIPSKMPYIFIHIAALHTHICSYIHTSSNIVDETNWL